uniref:F-box domain-containing protein n=1 Tax=Mycena chlorophos TaxID=658473 RepID=A0ABQ0LSV0_MYCCL|nr:predicted protein [Mycena chlorophos]
MASSAAQMQALLAHPQKQLPAVPYPVLSLPPEIISEIFIHTQNLSPKEGSDFPFYGSPNHPPLQLMLVCRTWHNIAVSTPALWSSFAVSFVGKHHLGPVFAAHLERTRNVLLDVEASGEEDMQSTDDFHAHFA